VTPAMDEPVTENMSVDVRRITQKVEVVRESIPFEAIMVPDDNLEIDTTRLDTPGAPGEYRQRFQLVYEDGKEVSRTLVDAWVASVPITRVTSFGRALVSRPLETSSGTVYYWRKIRMYATSYSKSTAGVSPDRSYYGITRLGYAMRKGIVAVDPAWIELGSKVFVPGYGVGLAADTGSAIKAKRIDLGFDDENLELWSRYVDVYLLDPPPARSKIRWILPSGS
jgi:3D (Asp-Asp-Asp) domain-containing protein